MERLKARVACVALLALLSACGAQRSDTTTTTCAEFAAMNDLARRLTMAEYFGDLAGRRDDLPIATDEGRELLAIAVDRECELASDGATLDEVIR
ncbi:hypothetical protein [Nocardioides sp. R-C-SC26]|uniref:hypothetical protein n=1 Tax=Nocardioides sp. R-C-SC26 TaxID=2870414 RepID=UPI001E4FCD72|nr:hypothetical protein [Nocardioides sp. R-C-SC26]